MVRFCVGLVTDIFLPSYWAASFGEGSESSTLLQSELATRQAGREEQIANPWRKFGTREDNGRFVCWGFVFSYCRGFCPVGSEGA